MSEKLPDQTVADLPQQEAQALSAEQAEEAGGGFSFGEIHTVPTDGSVRTATDPYQKALVEPR